MTLILVDLLDGWVQDISSEESLAVREYITYKIQVHMFSIL